MEKKRFKDFAQEDSGLDGEKMRIDELFNKEVHYLAYRIMQSKCAKLNGKECLQIQFEFEENGPKYIVFTNSIVLIRQFKDYAKELPFWATLRKKGSYYTMS